MQWKSLGLGVVLLALAAATGAGRAMAVDQAALAVEAPPPDLARIYFYRQSAPLLVAMEPEVIVNGRSIGSLGIGDVFFRDARPGRYQVFLSGDSEHMVELVLAPGDIGYVRATLRVGFGTTRLSAERINAALAPQEIDAMYNPTEGTEPQPPLQR